MNDIVSSSIMEAQPLRLGRLAFAWLSIFLAILIARWEIVDSPPYFDFAIFLWPEAEYLVRTGFDYAALFREPWVMEPNSGRAGYLISLLPGWIALILLATPSYPAAFVIYHLFTFACAALLVVFLWDILRLQSGSLSALLVGVAVLTQPILSTQIDMLGMEIPTTASVVLAVWLLSRGYSKLAVLACFLAFLMKATGLLATLSMLATLMLTLLTGGLINNKEHRQGLLFVTFVTIIALVAEWFVLSLGKVVDRQGRVGPPVAMILLWGPDVLFLGLLLAVLGLPFIWMHWRANAGRSQAISLRAAALIHELASKRPEVVFAIFFLLANIAAVSRLAFIPRYLTIMVPFLLLLIASMVFSWQRRLPGNILFGGLIIFNLLNWNGALLPNPEASSLAIFGIPVKQFANEGSFLERSHEYLADHRANLEVVRIVREKHAGEPLILGRPFVDFLGLPVLGSVTQPTTGYSINGVDDTVPGFADTYDLVHDAPPRPLVLRTKNSFYNFVQAFEVPPPGEEDEILYQSKASPGVVLYRKTAPDTTMRGSDWQQWYYEHMWPNYSLAYVVLGFLDREDLKSASDTLRLALNDPKDAGYKRMVRAGLLARLGQFDEASKEYFAAVKERPQLLDFGDPAEREVNDHLLPELAAARSPLTDASSDDLYQAGKTCLHYMSLADCAQLFALMVPLEIPDIESIVSPYQEAQRAARQGRIDQAILLLEQILSEAPDFPPALHLLGVLKFQSGQTSTAIPPLQQALALSSDNAALLADLGTVYARSGMTELAIQTLDCVSKIEPQNQVHRQRLMRLRRRASDE